MHRIALLVALLAALPFARRAGAEEPVKRLEEGRTYRFQITQDHAESAVMGTQTFESTTHLEQPLAVEVVAANEDGTVQVRLRFGPMKGRLALPMAEPVEFDTEQGLDDVAAAARPLARLRAATAGLELDARLDASGRLLAVTGYAAAMKQVFAAAGAENPMLNVALAGHRARLSDEHGAAELAWMFPGLPPAELAEGTSYTPDPGSLHECSAQGDCLALAETRTLRSRGPEAVVLGLEATSAPAAGAADSAAAGEPSAKPPATKFQASGTVRLDTADGIPLATDIEHTSTVTAAGPFGGDVTQQTTLRARLERSTDPKAPAGDGDER